ncbi:FAD-dependent oxidoreductase [Mesoplasma seiffertii]|uniref:FAD-dependent oxidoreductase n=1 Tax=Mesoplasma seiffertii TaxID=28224 RepID=UPI000479CB56|nr:FAD-dependent oxidoreductase [Mesoplasma seiffertii]
MKVIVIGTNHAGTTAVRTLKRLDPSITVTTYDRNDNISFLGCGIALWVKDEVKDPQGLFYASPETLAAEGIEVHMQHEWVGINPDTKTVLIKDLKTEKTFEDSYDKLIVATGSWPVQPPIPGINLDGVQICKNYHHGKILKGINNDKDIKNITIVGAGYIGVELVEAFHEAGKKVTLIDVADRIMPNYYGENFTSLIEKRMTDAGVKLVLGEKVVEFVGQTNKVVQVVTENSVIDTDYVVFCLGIKPQTGMLQGIVDLASNGSIKVNRYMQTSNEDIYAIGDCIEVYDNATERNHPIALATTSVRTGILAAMNIIKPNSLPSPGFCGSNAIDVFGMKMASVGITEKVAQSLNIDYDKIFFTDNDRPEFMSTTKPVYLEIIWDKATRKIIGAQVAGENNHTEIIHMFSLGIWKGLTIDELPLVDMFFLPHFNKPYNFVTLAGLEVLGLNYFKKDK